eukprot:389102_1
MAAGLVAVVGLVMVMPGQPTEKKVSEEETVRLSDVRDFEPILYVAVASCLITYGAIVPFFNIAVKFIQTTYGYDNTAAATCAAIPQFIVVFTSPIFGILIDKFG